MSVTVKVECDGNGCCNDLNFCYSENVEDVLDKRGWLYLADYGDYCSVCKPKVEAELAETNQ